MPGATATRRRTTTRRRTATRTRASRVDVSKPGMLAVTLPLANLGLNPKFWEHGNKLSASIVGNEIVLEFAYATGKGGKAFTQSYAGSMVGAGVGVGAES